MQELGTSSNSCSIQSLAAIWGPIPDTCPSRTLQISGHHFQTPTPTNPTRVRNQFQLLLHPEPGRYLGINSRCLLFTNPADTWESLPDTCADEPCKNQGPIPT